MSALKSEDIIKFFTSDEHQLLISDVEKKLLPHLPDIIDEYTKDFDGSEEPHDFVEKLKETFSILTDVYGDTLDYKVAIEAEIENLEVWVSENSTIRLERALRTSDIDRPTVVSGEISRSIFDDIDDG